MSEEMIFKDKTINELVTGLMAHLEQIGYRPSSLKTYGGIFNKLVTYCSEKRVEIFTMEIGESFVQDCYGVVLGEGTHFKNIYRAVNMVADFQRFGMVFKQKNTSPEGFSPEYEPLFESFLEYRKKRGIADSSLTKFRSYLFRLERFLRDRGVIHFNQLELHHINVYVESLAGYAKNTVSAALGMLRMLLDYACDNGYHHTSYSNALPTVRYAQTRRLPVTFSPDEIERILENIDTNNPTGKRNYAIILLAARLGLRVSDATGLRFDSVNWNAKTISITQQKTGVPLTLPIPGDVGWAVIEYLKHGRPESTCANIFIRHHAPYDALTPGFQKEVQRAVQKAGIKVPANKKFGMHAFRFSIASNMLSKGATVTEIAQVLGQVDPNVTDNYIRLAPTILGECALEVDF